MSQDLEAIAAQIDAMVMELQSKKQDYSKEYMYSLANMEGLFNNDTKRLY